MWPYSLVVFGDVIKDVEVSDEGENRMIHLDVLSPANKAFRDKLSCRKSISRRMGRRMGLDEVPAAAKVRVLVQTSRTCEDQGEIESR
jgi:hypothetical protein